MEHVYAALLLHEAGAELNERNLTAVLEAAGCPVTESRTRALVAALEGLEVDEFAAAGVETRAPARESADGTSTGPDPAASGAASADSGDDGGAATGAGDGE